MQTPARGRNFFPSCLATQRREHEAVELVAAQQREWLVLLERLAREAEELGELDPGTDPAQLAFELQALLVAANTSFILQGDAGVFEQARAAIRERLGAR
jgi:hypothetical protein